MKTYIVKATIVEEVCIAEHYGAANEYLSLDYIPGTAWWGAIAGLTGIQRGQQPSETFRRLFYSGEVVFTNLYPRRGAVRAHPIPLSARTRKSAPGFKREGQEPLFRDAESELFPAGVEDWLLDGPPANYDSDWESISGWYIGDPPECESISVEMVMRGHNDRAGRSGVTREGLLFTRQNIARRSVFKDVKSAQQFEGALRAHTAEGAAALEEFVKNTLGDDPVEIPIGRQPGCVRIQLQDAGEAPPYWQSDLEIDGDYTTLLSITLLSDAILLDRWLHPLSFLPQDVVAESLSLDAALIDGPYYHFSALREISGWNGAYSRPRELELAVAAGSAFLYLVDWPTEISLAERRCRLSSWQQRGIGLRTAEGFGEIRINDPFHNRLRRGN